MAPAESDQTRELLQDPYHLEFLDLAAQHTEWELEDALVSRLTQFLAELGTGWAFVGHQYKLLVGAGEYFADPVFYHLRLRRFICTNSSPDWSLSRSLERVRTRGGVRNS